MKKSQHKYVIGPKGHVLQEILASTGEWLHSPFFNSDECVSINVILFAGVSVEMPPLDSETETITLRGEPDRLGAALTQVYERANSVSFAEVEAPRWLHRFMIGRSGENIKKITQDLDKVCPEVIILTISLCRQNNCIRGVIIVITHFQFIFHQLHIEFSDDKDKITLEGPPLQVDKAREALETFARELVNKQF